MFTPLLATVTFEFWECATLNSNPQPAMVKASGFTERATQSLDVRQAALERLRCENELTKKSYLAF